MKKIISFALSLALVLPVTFTSASTTANAAETDSTKQLQRVESTLTELNKEYVDSTIEVDTSKWTEDYVNQISAYNDNELKEYLEGFYKDASNIETKTVDIKSVDSKEKGYVTYLNREGTVWVGVPSLGQVFMHILFNVNVANDRSEFLSGRVLDSWQEGVALSTYKPQSGSFEARGTKAYIRAKGLLTYGIPKTPLSATKQISVLFIDEITNGY
ncbi:hypothetical protein PTI45_04654 [Paenibacillus nuruki]|uniref:Uncharacterized protein n=1 Tax=Paenibacillus nuruki TaxID=1886670 RepID=A0A1E3KWU5_9BACL|nr:hypothetical protein [Paenibacillus nuruki]ODP26018.1 hypothetical protein PTI45_04654 [Paenibacillus nuruki]